MSSDERPDKRPYLERRSEGLATSVLVTGASGFVGRNLVRYLLAAGHTAVIGATRDTGWQVPGARRVGAPELGPDADWRDVLCGADCVVHCAGLAHEAGRGASLEEFRRVNALGTASLAEQAAQAGVRRLVFLSSVAVHGRYRGRAFREADELAPETAYALSKHEAELRLREVSSRTGLEVVIVRPPLIYGPQAPGNFGLLLRLARSRVPLPLAGVENRRSLIGVDNLASLLVRCIHHERAANETFLVSDGEDVSTAGMIRMLRAAMGRSAGLWPVPAGLVAAGAAVFGRQDLYEKVCGDLTVDASKVAERLDWVAPLSVEQGMYRAVRGSAGRP